MVTQYQYLPTELKDCKCIDIYSQVPIRERPIPGRLIYTDGAGRIFEQLPDGTIQDL